MTTKICYLISFLTGIGLLFIGTRFLLSPLHAAFDYGMLTNTNSDFSFHYVKGIRDLFSGLLLLLLVLAKERRALAIVLLAATVVPLGDFIIVLGQRGNDWQFTLAHLVAVAICIITGSILLIRKKEQQLGVPEMSFRIIQSVEKGGSTITECDLLPGAKTPWHYHTLFSEQFELLVGTLEVGRSGLIYQLNAGDEITILPHETHLFHNRSAEKCRVRTVLTPGNIEFEQASRILLGLTRDGLTNGSGVPKKLSDLALFLYLNNSKMMGFLKIFQPIFSLIAKIAIKRGRLKVLLSKYCGTV
ncbi:DUF4267 domain-containing protein [Sphingobacterium detergens]|uniref:Quercetin dioxygenase-like cupin family protein n=1 Tax=Sphingobacterium detergens TaxID=1145106 RepID=A0A420BK78_SPHD1|nr:DUF4267 domain-containing protein [Sphingobacterium detergens]RKE57109.1 quercetin dioxygenase-like cupin family protein [Sphingobacterium detergens]